MMGRIRTRAPLRIQINSSTATLLNEMNSAEEDQDCLGIVLGLLPEYYRFYRLPTQLGLVAKGQ